MSFRKTLEPCASAWSALAEKARMVGLVHGSEVFSLLTDTREAKDLLRDMVEAGDLVPCKLDIAGADRSHVAFMGLVNYRRGYIESAGWCTDFACLWTYVAGSNLCKENP